MGAGVTSYATPQSSDTLAARDRLVMEHVALVKVMAGRLANRLPSRVDVSELISVGVLGLIDAAGRFEPSLGVPFGGYARRRIQGAMLDSLRDLDWAPRAVRRLRREVDSAIAELRHELQREPEAAEIASALKVSEAEYERMLDQLRSADVAAIQQASAADEATSLLELAIDPSESPYTRLERHELREHLARALTEMPERERQILALYYEQELTLAEIGAVIGVGESRVSQLRTQAIARLRTLLADVMQVEAGL
jgi:RNA polymerase sigma factor for flagellar operon FliA